VTGLVNLYGGPGSGKSTVASYLFSWLRMHGVEAELVGEAAKEFVHDRSFESLKNQVLIAGLQWQRVNRLIRSGCGVAISDSPIILGAMYSESLPYHAELLALLRKLDSLAAPAYNVFIRRTWPYVTTGRTQKTEEEARAFDAKAIALAGYIDMEISNTPADVQYLAEMLLSKAFEWKGSNG